jgi:hypothetical protein
MPRELAYEEPEQPGPTYVGTFLYRDFHLGNVLCVRDHGYSMSLWTPSVRTSLVTESQIRQK